MVDVAHNSKAYWIQRTARHETFLHKSKPIPKIIKQMQFIVHGGFETSIRNQLED